MIKFFARAAAASLALASFALAGPKVDQAAPAFSGTTADGQVISLDQFAGKRVVLEWTNHDCPFVKKHYESGNMQSLQRRAVADDIVWVSIISSAPGEQGHVSASMANTLTKDRKAAPTHVILDETGAIGRLYDAKTTPHMFVIDEAQTLQYAGAIDSIPSAKQADIARSDNYVRLALTSLRQGQPVVTKQSKPYGCSVKYAS